MVENGLSLRYYIELLIRQWKWIVLWTFAAIVAAAAVTIILPRVYESHATVAILRSRTQVELDARITTLTDYELARSDLESRRDAMVALLTSNVVIREVLNDVGDRLDPDLRDISSVRDMVTVRTSGDLISINIRSQDPELATDIANSWAQHYERYINSVYAGGGQVFATNTEQQIAAAYEAYLAEQNALQTFIREDTTGALVREVESRQALLLGYQESLVGVQLIPVTNAHTLIASYYSELLNIESALANANALLEQTRADTDSTAANLANLVALVKLRSQVFASTDPEQENSTVLQIDLGSITAERVEPSDVEALIQILEARREAAETRIATVEGAVNEEPVETTVTDDSTLRSHMANIEEEIRLLQSEIETQTALQRELEQGRERAWETYSALLGRQVEEDITLGSADAEVRIADAAVVPKTPVSRGLIRNVVIAGLFAGMVSVFTVVAADWWRKDKAEVEGGEPRYGREIGDPRLTPATGRGNEAAFELPDNAASD